MLRAITAIALSLAGLIAISIGQDDPTGLFRSPAFPDPALPKPSPGNTFIPDRRYEPKPGDEAVLFASNGLPIITKYRLDLIDLVGVLSKNETGKLQKMLLDDKFKIATNGTKVKVHLLVDLNYRGAPYSACSLKVIDGPFAGQTACTLKDFVVHLQEVELTPLEIEIQKAREETIRKTKVAIEERPATLLKMAENLEKSGKKSAAIDNYREIIKIAPKSSHAKAARARIEALKGDR